MQDIVFTKGATTDVDNGRPRELVGEKEGE